MYDAIIVGARCAGAPTAMLLARRGFKVLLVDRATFPQRHHLHTHPVAAWRREVGIRGDERGAQPIEERARIVIGADGVNSFVSRAVRAPRAARQSGHHQRLSLRDQRRHPAARLHVGR
jgi:flavin-dependent dehydrogenase